MKNRIKTVWAILRDPNYVRKQRQEAHSEAWSFLMERVVAQRRMGRRSLEVAKKFDDATRNNRHPSAELIDARRAMLQFVREIEQGDKDDSFAEDTVRVLTAHYWRELRNNGTKGTES